MTVHAARPSSLPPAGDRFVVVEASAGTGKTYFLEHRVVDLVLAGAELGQILLVTFTDKAVAELRLRIRDLLDRLSRQTEDVPGGGWLLDDAARTRLRDAVTAFDAAPIFTIHGFCYRVLVEDAFAAQRLFQQTQIADEVAFDRAFFAVLRERFAMCTPDRELLAAYLTRGDTVDKLRDLLLACARRGFGLPSRATYLSSTELGEQLRAVFGDEAAQTALLARMSLSGNDKRYVPPWVAAIGHAVAEWDGTSVGTFALCDAIRKSGTSEPGPKLLARVAKLPALAPVADLLRRALATTSLDEAIAAVMLEPVLTRVAADKADAGLFDYNDMLQLVQEALHGPRGGELAARLRARTPWVMIDEFQDTDPVQWNIFRTVWMHDAARGLTIVGDPKQAIYGFRGADVATYEAARDELLRTGATRVDLDVNRRSTAPLVDAVNRILLGDGVSPLLDATTAGHSIRYDHPVTASGDVAAPKNVAPVAVFELSGPGKREEARVALAGAIGVEIERLRGRGVSLGECMVLTRTNADSAGVAAALRANGLACTLVEGDALFETREAHELRAVLAAIAAPRDRSARLRALRTRFFDVPWADLMRVVDAPDHHVLIGRLFDWAALAARRAYEPLFRRLVEDSRFAERALVLGGGERAITNTWHLIELLLEEVARSRCDLHELVTKLGRWISDGADLPDDRDVQRAALDSGDTLAVRILTVHKAKGLEAPYVFVYGGASPPRASNVHALRDGAGRALIVGPQDESIERRLEAEQTAEHQRLAYVALTRAKLRLYLPRYPDDAIDRKSMYWQIQRCLAPLAPRHADLFEPIAVAMGAPAAPPAPTDALSRFEPPPPPITRELRPIEGARAGLAMLSYTRLGRELESAAVDSAGPAEPATLHLGPGELPVAIDAAEFDADVAPDELDAATPPAPDELPPGIDSGLFVHDLFEHADLDVLRRSPDADSWLAEPTVAAMFAERGRERGIAPVCHAHAARIVHAALTKPLELVGRAPLPPLADADAFAREIEFAYPISARSRDRGLVTGFIDALAAFGDELWVIDYKSDVLAGDPAQVAAEHVREHYTIQQRLYGLAADRMRGARTLGGMIFAFVRYGIAVALPIDDARLAEWTEWVASLRTEGR
jgi:exodeoxyribonuclease V beta subunit